MGTGTSIDISLSGRRRVRSLVEIYFDVQDTRIRTDHRIQNYAEAEALVGILGEEEVERLVNCGDKNVSYKGAIRDLKEEKNERHGEFQTIYDLAVAKLESDDNHKKVNDLAAQAETILKKQIQAEIKSHPLWTDWLSRVMGIGPIIAGGLIAWINIKKCPHAGNLMKYAGLAVVTDSYQCANPQCMKTYSPDEIKTIEERVSDGEAQEAARCPACHTFLKILGHADRRQKGQVAGYNPKLKTLMWKAGQSFVKMPAEKSGYRQLYDQFRKRIESQPCNKVHKNEKQEIIPCFKAHMHAKATRATTKIFCSHVYQQYRKFAGLPFSKPFAFGMLGHDVTSMIEPIYDRAEEK